MPSVQSLAALAALYQAVSATPAGPLNTRDKPAFRVNQVSAGFKAYQPPAVGLLQTYNKYAKVGAVAPDTVVAAAAAQQSGAVTATPEDYDEAYLCPVTIGGQTLNLDFDTGSSDLWVFSTLQASSQTTGHKLYNPNDSTAKVKSGYTWEISYGDGSSASGKVYADVVKVGPVTATSQAVEAATSASASFSQDTSESGLLGLAFSSINTVEPVAQTTFFDTVKSTLAQPLFTADLKKGQPGSYDFGFIDTTKYTGAITYVPVDSSQGFWSFSVGGYGVGDSVTSTSKFSAIADTGTSLLLLSPTILSAYYAKVSGATNSATYGGYVFNCNAKLPDFSVKIGSTTFTLPGSYINYAPVTNTLCYGGLQSNAGVGFSIFGDIFLKNFFVVFSQVGGSPQLGFAAQ